MRLVNEVEKRGILAMRLGAENIPIQLVHPVPPGMRFAHTASCNPVFMPVLRLNIIPPRESSRAARRVRRAHVVKTENRPLSPFDRPAGGARRRLRNHPGCRRRSKKLWQGIFFWFLNGAP